MKVCRHLIIAGRVQGVCFRDAMVSEAQRLGVTGWVRNRSDGTVEAMVQGDPQAVRALIDWAHRGPELARVAGVQVSPGTGEFETFARIASA